MLAKIDPSWHALLKHEFEQHYFEQLAAFV